MNEFIKILISILILILGILIGNILKKYTQDELEQGKKWFKLLTFSCLIGGLFGLIIGNDWILFSLFFIAIVTSRSLILRK
jgi:formate hydrogenlyase subunit 3/multisubunit Na+/H+ antiporter MnhD subunit